MINFKWAGLALVIADYGIDVAVDRCPSLCLGL